MDKIETKIGKDVIESLTLGMYEDSRFIYREYIQNSADQIDKAVAEDLLHSLQDGKIEMNINQTTRTISIFDNATGIESNQVQAILKNIAQSTKDRTKNKGFRGIGRLGGLAYCDKLIFETSFKGEAIKSYLLWDAQKLKAIINNRATKEEATTVIDEVTDFYTEKEEIESHYFKVTLEGISNKILLDKEHIYQYLSMVAPVSYNKGFIYKNKIYDKAKELSYNMDEYPVFLNKDKVYKSYTTSIYKGENGNKSKIDEVYDIETYEIRNSKYKLLAWGWYSISQFKKVIPSINNARGLRLRKGNIQIGLENTLIKLFSETRGTNYFFGEIHAVSSELIPNARRDYFLDNAELKDFENLIKLKFLELHKLYHFSSEIRSDKKKIDDFIDFSEEYEEKLNTGGFTNKKEKEKYKKQFNDYKEKATIAEKKLKKTNEKISQNPTAQKTVYERIVGKNEANVEDNFIREKNSKTKYLTDDISTLNRKDRKLVSRIFTVIDNVLPKEIAGILKEKIKEEML